MSDAPGPPRGPVERGPQPPHPAPRQPVPSRADGPPQYTKYRARPRLLPRRGGDAITDLRRDLGREDDRPGAPKPRRRWSWKRVLKWVALAVVGWIALSIVLFLISAQIQSSKVSDE